MGSLYRRTKTYIGRVCPRAADLVDQVLPERPASARKHRHDQGDPSRGASSDRVSATVIDQMIGDMLDELKGGALMVVRTYERRHQYQNGSIVASVAEDDCGCYTATVCVRHPDGRKLVLQISEERCSVYSDLEAAKRAADEHISCWIGHHCSSQCESWPSAVRH